MNRTPFWQPYAVFIVAFLYLALLAAKTWTWVYASGDSGDWLASSIWWMNSQPFGSPLYVLLGHFVSLIDPPHLVVGMVMYLSAVPGAVTVAMTYLTAKQMTDSPRLGLVASLVYLGSFIAMTQATVVEEYALASMFVALAFYFYINQRRKLTVFMLALGAAVHVIVAVIAVIWLVLHWRELKLWWKTFPIFIVFGILPYALVPVLMYLDTPKLIAGSLSFGSLNAYLGSSGTIGSISWFEFLYRMPQAIGVFVVSLGFALVPLIFGLRRPFSKPVYMIVVTIYFSLWLYLTDKDPTTWTFMGFAMPLIAVLVAVGLKNMKPVHTRLVTYGAVVIVLVNAVFLNANLITNTAPLATSLEKVVKALPDGSAVVTCSGGPYGLGMIYIMAQGKDVFPVYFTSEKPDSGVYADENEKSQITGYAKDAHWRDYTIWLDEHYGVSGMNTQEIVGRLLAEGRPVYILLPTITPYWEGVFQLEGEPVTVQAGGRSVAMLDKVLDVSNLQMVR